MLDSSGNLDRRTRASQDLLGMTPSSEELLTEEIDGQLYSYKREWRCMVCSAPDDVRKLIDTLLVYPKGYTETLELVTPLLEARGVPEHKRPSWKSIRNHQKRHLPFDKLAVREIAERRASERGIAILQGKDRLLTAEAVLELIVQRGWESLVNRTQIPKVAEVITAATKLRDLETEAAGSITIEELMMQTQLLIKAVRENVPPDMWDNIVADIRRAKEAMELAPAPPVPGRVTEDVE